MAIFIRYVFRNPLSSLTNTSSPHSIRNPQSAIRNPQSPCEANLIWASLKRWSASHLVITKRLNPENWMFWKSILSLALISLLLPTTPAQSINKAVDRSSDSVAPRNEAVFVVGERLVYDVSWADFVVAGELTVETKARRDFDGVDAFHVTAQAQSVGLVSAIVYKVNDVYESFIDAATLQPFRAAKNTRHGKKRQQSAFTLDQQGRTAQLSDGRKIPIPSNTHDVASLFYAVRAMDLTQGKARTFTLIEDGKLYEIKAEPEGREKITVHGARYDVVRVSTKAVRAGATRDPYQFKFFVTSDSRRLPVMMTAEPSWGMVRMELTSATGMASNESTKKQ
jgi:hypothetical protein